MWLLMRHHDGKVVLGETRVEVAIAAGAKLSSRVLTIGDINYNSYSEEFKGDELIREFGRDAVRLLVKNHGWTLYKEYE